VDAEALRTYRRGMDEVTDEAAVRELLARHGYNPGLPAQYSYGAQTLAEHEGLVLNGDGDVVPGTVRRWVCELEGVTVDGHRFDPDYEETHCRACGKELEPGKLRVCVWRRDPVNQDIAWYTLQAAANRDEVYHAVRTGDGTMSVVSGSILPLSDPDLRARVTEAIERIVHHVPS
jgi:hypothetical protein